jgi:hypothetical protein
MMLAPSLSSTSSDAAGSMPICSACPHKHAPFLC